MTRGDRSGRAATPHDLSAVADLLWRTDTEEQPEDRPRLSVRRIVNAAVAAADAEGLAALSMQRVAAELGCTAMALYRHIPGKDQLIAAMTDFATGRPPTPPSPPAGWRAEVEAWVASLWDLYLRHPWMLRVPTSSAPVGPNELAWFEALLRPLHRAGLPREELIPLATFVSSAVRDLARVATELDPESAAAYGEVLARRLDPERFPLLCSLAGEEGLDEDEDGDVTPIVRHGITRLLDGIEAAAAPR
ncbi:TetR/AcrR family transcriptional regulator C-terminal domain-containing protein [Streptomyces sp. NBC_01353]|uniref:TetR/AcrR family transcriptional regulator C-terminal domain-containing protein n=1 Tax=Streptomyces sp. NBC_01353 TaxID=2903835 RepID=UPI002E31EE7E|nr:TetR/AcrR family transcriptional regulator C-terminal domain-containing protein [Streptomyces sp. NBC_01353]